MVFSEVSLIMPFAFVERVTENLVGSGSGVGVGSGDGTGVGSGDGAGVDGAGVRDGAGSTSFVDV